MCAGLNGFPEPTLFGDHTWLTAHYIRRKQKAGAMINSESPTAKMRGYLAPRSIVFRPTSRSRAGRIRAEVATESEFFAGAVLLQPLTESR
jgi:hypothetical protein